MRWMTPEFDNTFLMGSWGSHNVDIILRQVVTKWGLITKGEGGQESGKNWLHNKWTLPKFVIRKLLSN